MTVYLVGAGPGDPGLITVRGATLLAKAEVVVFDRLTTRPLIELAPASAEMIDVGKSAGRATVPQDEINALLVERGRAGLEVVRLKGGDPFVFGRGGEEAAALMAAGVEWARARGCTEFASDALLDNSLSHAAHKALGFVETCRIVCFKLRKPEAGSREQ